VKYLDKSFSTPANSKAFVDNWDAIFGEGKPKKEDEPEPVVDPDAAGAVVRGA
jgi:hypothetical protein